MEFKKVFTLPAVLILMTALVSSCDTDDSVEPSVDPCQADPCASGCASTCPLAGGQVSREDVVPDGNVVTTDNGYQVDGSLTMDFDSAGTVVFNNADVDVQFDENDRMTGMTGTTEIPSMSNYFAFENPVTADVGYFTGKFLNENRDFEIRLKDDIYYFVFNIAVNLELRIGANNDAEATKPLSLKVPHRGNLTLITDFSDPMFFFSVGGSPVESEVKGSNGKSRILGVSFGASFHGNLEYYPTNPTDPVVEFGARAVRGGTFSFWKVITGKSMLYENVDFGVDFNLKEPLESGIKAGYSGGWNGEVGLSLPITSFASFEMPIGEGSTGITALGNSVTGFTGKAFVKGILDPDRSWWPDFIPVDWGGNLQASGYIEETGIFDMGLTGEFNIRLVTETRGLNGMMRFTNQALTLAGTVAINDELHQAKAIMNSDSTTFLASRPDNFSKGIQETVSQQIDSTFAQSEKALADLEKAAEDYEFELSLRGLRATLPELIDRALDIVDDAVAAGIANGRSQANKILKDNDRALCSDDISTVVNAAAEPYRDALNRLKNAINNNQDTEQTRVEFENALRHLASMNKIDKSVQVKIVHGNKAVLFVSKCTQKSTVYRSVKITADILTSSQVAQLNEAADNVKYIQETSEILIEAQRIVDELPSQEELEAMKSRIQECVSELTGNIGESGMTIYHHKEKITYFIMINGKRMEADEYDIFNQNDVIKVARGKVTACQ